MNIRDLSFLAVRVLSIYLFILTLKHLVGLLDFAVPTYLQLMGNDIAYAKVFLAVGVPVFVMMFGGIVLWMLAGKLSKWLVPNDSSAAEAQSTIRLKEMEGIVLSIVGLIILILSLASMVNLLLNYISVIKQDVRFDNRGYMYSIAEQVIRIAAGCLLLYKAEGIAAFLRNIRNLGLKHIKKTEDN